MDFRSILMSKEIIRGHQFSQAKPADEGNIIFSYTPEQQKELTDLLEGIFHSLTPGQIITGKVIKSDNDGVIVDIGYKSNALIPTYEFTEHERKKFIPGAEIEVILNELEDYEGNINISYEQAKAQRAWKIITNLFEENKPVEGIVTHKVKGGLNVDIGIPAFLPGSQVDLQRVTDFDHWVGQTILAYILKINKKRGNVIISRRKYLYEQRTEQRKAILDTLHEEKIIQGVVKNITNYGAFIDIGGVDGLLHITDMTWGRISHPSELVRIGDTITVKVLSFDKESEKISLGMKQLTENPWQQLSNLKEGSKVTGTISSITDYGLFVNVAPGVEGLIHISEISWTDRIDNLKKHYTVGDEIEAVIVSLDKENRRMSLSIKQMSQNPWQELTDKVQIGQKIKGKITNITDFGIFVQIQPGIDGLVYISDLSWTEHIAHPKDRYQLGEEVEAVILDIDEKQHRVSLGIKQLIPNPWDTIETEYPVGSIVEGTVSKITNFGAFVKLASGIEGLVHAKDFGDTPIETVISAGQIRKFKVTKIKSDEQKIALSIDLDSDSSQKYSKKYDNSGTESKKHSASEKPKSHFQVALEEHAQRTKSEPVEKADANTDTTNDE